MIETEIKILALSKIPGMGKQSLNQFLDCNDITKQSIDQMTLSISEFARKKKRVKPPLPEEMNRLYQESEAILERQEKCGIFAVSRYSEFYPAKFKELEKPVDLFFITGNKELLLGDRHIAIIGTREASEHGFAAGKRLAKLFSERGEIIVSGLAIGCDTSGHLGCLEAGGKTIAILPSPITDIMPKNNRKLAESIVENDGLLISEYYDGQQVQRGYYVDRDRLQSGLSDAVVVVETDVKGGTMHTVGYAKELGRLLACYNHPIKYLGSSQTRGTQKLIKDGDALPLGSKEDIETFFNKLKEYRAKREEKSQINSELKKTDQMSFDIPE